MLYILKIKGTDKIPDFVQIRDSEMTLIAYFRLSQIEQGLRKNGFTEEILEIKTIIESIDFGIIHKYISK
ncbi:hypothetical protein OAQ21_01990 [Flavobacteriales bacterium]|nr:hypothetical protein [Flavobacteriales bacterium]